MATNRENIDRRDDETTDEEERKTPGNWLGRWVMILAIIAFLAVYVTQLWRGAGLTYAVLIATAAMGVVGFTGLIVRQMLLRTASRERADSILEQMSALQEDRNRETDADGAG